VIYPCHLILRRVEFIISVACLLPLALTTTGCGTRPTQASTPAPIPVIAAPDAEDKAMEAKMAYYERMQKKVEAKASKSYNQQVAQNAQAEKKGVVIGGSGNVTHSEQSALGQSDYSDAILKGTPDQIAAGKRYDDAVNDAEAANSFLESRDQGGIDLGQHMFGPNEIGIMSENVSRMKNDLDVMQQNSSAMSPGAQASADPGSAGLPPGPLSGGLSGGSAKDMIQQDIDKWQTAINSNQR
jgi:hypothetical protein